jgi:hypothetical protein
VKVVISYIARLVERLHFPAGPVKRSKKNRLKSLDTNIVTRHLIILHEAREKSLTIEVREVYYLLSKHDMSQLTQGEIAMIRDK